MHRHDDQRSAKRSTRHAGCRQRQDQEGAEHDQVAMREIDQPHDAEDQRQPGGEERIKPAEQDALESVSIQPSMRLQSEIGGVDGVAGQLAAAGRSA